MTFMVGGIQTCHGRLADTKPSSSGADRGCRTAYCRFLSGPAGGALGLIVTPRLRSSSTISLAPALPLSARIAVSRASASSELRSLPEPESSECKVYRQPADWKTRPLTTRGVPGAFTANAGYGVAAGALLPVLCALRTDRPHRHGCPSPVPRPLEGRRRRCGNCKKFRRPYLMIRPVGVAGIAAARQLLLAPWRARPGKHSLR